MHGDWLRVPEGEKCSLSGAPLTPPPFPGESLSRCLVGLQCSALLSAEKTDPGLRASEQHG